MRQWPPAQESAQKFGVTIATQFRVLGLGFRDMSCSLNSLKGGYIGDYIGDY